MTGSALPQLLRPRALRPGDLVVVASLSGPLHAAYEPDLQQAVVVLERMGFRVRRAPLLEAGRNHWWSAATPAEIAEEFNVLLRDPEVRAIIAHDGGQTVLGYLDLIDFEAITNDPKPILGYSDMIGGVINRIVLAQATRFALSLEWFDGAVLFWEEAGGLASHVWSYLQVLRHSGILDRISGMLVGVPHAIDGLDTSPTLPELVLDVLGTRDIPVLGNVEFGHAGPNLPMPVGLRIGLDAQQRTLSLLEPAVQARREEFFRSGVGWRRARSK